MGITDLEKVDLGGLHHLYTIGFFFVFYCLSFFLLEVSEVSNYWIRFLSKLIPVNLSQYRGVVGAFKSWFIYIKQHKIFMNVFSQSKVKQIVANETFTIFISFLNNLINFKWLVFYKFASNQSHIYQFISLQDFLYLYSASIHTPYLVIFIIFNWSGDTKKNPEPKANSYQFFYLSLASKQHSRA